MFLSEKKLGDVATLVMGQSPEGNTYNHDGIGLPLLNGPTEFGAIHPHCSLFTTDSKRESEPGDLLFCVRGSTTGRMNWGDRKYSLGRGVAAIRGSTATDTRFIRYCIEDGLEQLLKLAGGGTFPNLTKTDLLEFVIPYPPERGKIATILSTYDDLIENNLRRINILEEMAQNLYCEWFVKFRFPGYQSVRMVDSPLGKIPEGWDVITLGELTAVVTKGTTPTTLGKKFTEDGIAFVKVESIDEGGAIIERKLARIDEETHELLKRSQLQEGDILFSIAGAIGRVATVTKHILPANTNQALAIIRPKDKLMVPYMYLVIRSDEFVNFSLGRVVQTAQANVSLSVLKSAHIVVPPVNVLGDFCQKAGSLLQLKESLSIKNSNLTLTRDLLLPKLVSGELDVSELPIATGQEAA